MQNTPPKLNFTNSYAFLIGINAYKSNRIATLKSPIWDTVALAHKLEKHQFIPFLLLDEGSSEENLKIFKEIFKENEAPLTTILPQKATKENIEHLYRNVIREKLQEKDRIFFYFAGHGIADDAIDEAKEDPQGYLMPVDADPDNFDSLVSMNDLNLALETWKGKHGLIVMDCCFAGAFQWSLQQTKGRIIIPKKIYDLRFEQYGRDPAWQVITSSASDQEAIDLFKNRALGKRDQEGKNHSPFAQALLDGLDGAADLGIVEGEGDGIITATELYLYLRQRVELETMERNQTLRQTPTILNLIPKHKKGEYLFLNLSNPKNLPPFPKDKNPYPGLMPYREEDAEFFYGRDDVVVNLTSRLGNIGKPSDRLVILSGGTGSGKTSLIQAGVIPFLRKKNWKILPTIRPKQYLKDFEEISFSNIQTDLIGVEKKLLVIDQYEEMIGKVADKKRWLTFEKNLKALLEKHPSLYVLIAIRSNYEDQLQRGKLGEWWQDCRFPLPILTSDDLLEVIENPVEQVNLYYESPGLVNQIKDEINESPEALPMLCYTLQQLVNRVEKRAITEKTYQKIGGVDKVIWAQADKTFEEFGKKKTGFYQKSMKKIMLRMVRFDDSMIHKRKVFYLPPHIVPKKYIEETNISAPLLFHELNYSQDHENTIIEEVIEILTDARLIHIPKDKITSGQLYIEPVHDALITTWPTLHQWIETIEKVEKDQLRLERQLWEAIVDYEKVYAQNEINAKRHLWHNNPRLESLERDLLKANNRMNAMEMAFIRKSVDLRIRNAKLRQRLIVATMIVLMAISSIAVLKSFEANKEAARAERNEDRALLLQGIAEQKADSLEQTLIDLDSTQKVKLKVDYDNLILEGESALQDADFENAKVAAKTALSIDSSRKEAINLMDRIEAKTANKRIFDQWIRYGERLAISSSIDSMKKALSQYNKALKLNIDDNLIKTRKTDLEIKVKSELKDQLEDADAFFKAGGMIGYTQAIKSYQKAAQLMYLIPIKDPNEDALIQRRIQQCQDGLKRLEKQQ